MDNFIEDLPPSIKELAERGNIKSPNDVIASSKKELLNIIGNEKNVENLRAAAVKFVAAKFLTVNDMLRDPVYLSKWSRITFGCNALDKCTHGGLVTRGITEIHGESGAGKTQIILQLSLTVQLPPKYGGLGKGVAYVCTEDAFPSQRMYQIAEHFTAKYPNDKINFLSNIHIEHILESEDLLECVSKRLGLLMQKENIGLIVIDSVAAIFRLNSNYIDRAKQMRRLANDLLFYVDKYCCAVVCVNQVTTVNDANISVPCLGLAWACLGRTRIKISKIPKQIRQNNQYYTVRKFDLLYSPQSPSESSEFIITSKGVCDV